MCQSSMQISPGGGCNDYSLLTANTSITTVSVGNTNLDGSGTLAHILTAGGNGAIVRSITIKATGPVTQGMVRLFVGDSSATVVSLYKEVPIPTSPVLASTPTPSPVLETFTVVLKGDLKLLAGFKLYATTQNSETFNIMVESVNWAYPATLPSSCCNYKQEVANTGITTISTANTALDGTGTITTVFTAASNPSNGSAIKAITIKALQSTNVGMIRLFLIHNSAKKLFLEIPVPQSAQSGFEPSFKFVINENYYLSAGDSIGASTQIAQSFAITLEGVNWSYPIS